ncbi:MAG: hypothetical protein GY827_12270 [Cytophagales bacterium]|nr:hypothetical protein [Cytophagales bacterium]
MTNRKEELFQLLREETSKEKLQNWLYQCPEEELIPFFGEENYVILIAENYFDFSCKYLQKYLINKLLPEFQSEFEA